MKKTFCLIVSLIIIIMSVFTGCQTDNDEATIKNLIDTAFKMNGKLNNLNLSTVTKQYFDYGNTTYMAKKESEFLAHNLNNTKRYEMSEIVKTSNSTSAEIGGYEEYYKDGYYYTTRYGGAFKIKLAHNEVDVINNGSAVNVKNSDMRSVGYKTETDDEDQEKWGKGATTLTFTCKNSLLESFVKDKSEENAQDYDDVKVKSGKGEYVINSDGYLVYEKLVVYAVMNVDGEEVTSKISNEVTYNKINKSVDPYNPEESDYIEIDNMQTIIDITDATTKTVMSDDYIMDMTSSADITQGSVKAGYNRTYKRMQNLTGEEYAQKTITSYNGSEGAPNGEPYESSYYYTDGRYYQYSDLYNQKLYCVIDYSKFLDNIYATSSVPPANMYKVGMMKDFSSKETEKGTEYSFSLNTETEDGLTFLSSIVGPYKNFSGDFSTADIKVNSSKGTMRVDKNGYLYEIDMECDLLVKFQQGDVAIKFEQKINASKIGGNVKCEFPNFSEIDYERVEQSELLGAFTTTESSLEQ